MGRHKPRHCGRFEDAISALIDHEDPGLSDALLSAHLSHCPSCRQFAQGAEAFNRRFRVRVAETVPDLTESVLAEIRAAGNTDGQVKKRAAMKRLSAIVALTAAVVALLFGGYTLGAELARIGRPTQPATSAAGKADSYYPGATVLSSTLVVPKPTVALTDTNGRSYDLATQTAGRVTLVYFGYTHCPNICPINMALIAAAINQLPASLRHAVTVVFVTTDPSRDTPPVIRAWLDHFTSGYPGDPTFVGLTGSPNQIHQAEQQVGMPLSYAQSAQNNPDGGYQVVHAGYTLIYSQSGFAHLTVDDSETLPAFTVTLKHVITDGSRSP